MQRRAYQRFMTGLPVMFSWRTNGTPEVSWGIMRDISVQGMYVVAPSSPPEQTTVRCEVLLPALEEDAGPTVFTIANTVGKVLRRETGEDQIGFAVHNQTLELRTRELADELL